MTQLSSSLVCSCSRLQLEHRWFLRSEHLKKGRTTVRAETPNLLQMKIPGAAKSCAAKTVEIQQTWNCSIDRSTNSQLKLAYSERFNPISHSDLHRLSSFVSPRGSGQLEPVAPLSKNYPQLCPSFLSDTKTLSSNSAYGDTDASDAARYMNQDAFEESTWTLSMSDLQSEAVPKNLCPAPKKQLK